MGTTTKDSRQVRRGNTQQQRLRKGPTLILLETRFPLLNSYPNRLVAQQLADSLLRALGFLHPPHPTFADNLCSVKGLEDMEFKNIAAEVRAGRVASPFHALPILNLQASPLGVVPKKNPGEFHLIHHLSHPDGFQSTTRYHSNCVPLSTCCWTKVLPLSGNVAWEL